MAQGGVGGGGDVIDGDGGSDQLGGGSGGDDDVGREVGDVDGDEVHRHPAHDRNGVAVERNPAAA